MQRLLVQSACEAFAAADLTKSRSNSGTSSVNQSTASCRSKSGSASPRVERVTRLRRGLYQNRRSSSLCSISGGRGSPETRRGKTSIRRSESTHLSRTLSPLLGMITLISLIAGLWDSPILMEYGQPLFVWLSRDRAYVRVYKLYG